MPKDNIETDLFGSIITRTRSTLFTQAAATLGILKTGSLSEGRQVKIELPEGIMLDMFLPAAKDFFRQLVIRTGSAEYVTEVIAKGWLRAGWCGVKDVGLRRIDQCFKNSSNQWQCTNKNPALPPVWKSEEEFFKWLGVQYAEPHMRSVTSKQYNNFLSR